MATRSDASISATCCRWLGAAALLFVAHGAHAASVFKCVDTRGGIAFQATPCAADAKQTPVEIHEQPLIDPTAPLLGTDDASMSSVERPHQRTRGGGRAGSNRSRKDKQPVSYECRARDGEVFYRHSRCPGSVPGDGLARFGVDPPSARSSRGRRNTRGDAWNAIPVTARKIPRSEACQKIDSIAATDRDGSVRDEQVSVYEHNLGRDLCSGY